MSPVHAGLSDRTQFYVLEVEYKLREYSDFHYIVSLRYKSGSVLVKYTKTKLHKVHSEFHENVKVDKRKIISFSHSKRAYT